MGAVPPKPVTVMLMMSAVLSQRSWLALQFATGDEVWCFSTQKLSSILAITQLMDGWTSDQWMIESEILQPLLIC